MELFDDIDSFRWTAKFREERPQAYAVYAIKCLGEVNEHYVEVLMLFPALFLDFPLSLLIIPHTFLLGVWLLRFET